MLENSPADRISGLIQQILLMPASKDNVIMNRIFESESSKGKICKRRKQVSEETKQFAFPKNRVHYSEWIRSNKQRKQNIMVDCVKGVKSILEAVKLLFLD